MDLTQIKYFLALAETLNFTRAAESCHVTQPGLTKSIQKLEDELGGCLWLREGKNSQLTEFGRVMLPLLQHAYDAANAARVNAKEFCNQDKASIRIGLGPFVSPETIVPVLTELHLVFPALNVSLCHASTATLNERLVGSEIDVAFTVQPDGLNSRANIWKLFDDAVVVHLPPQHCLADSETLRIEHLLTENLIGRPGLEALPQLHSALSARIRHLASAEEQLAALLRAGLGFTLSTARHRVAADIACRPLDPECTISVHLITMPGRRPGRAVDAFVRLARARDWQGG